MLNLSARLKTAGQKIKHEMLFCKLVMKDKRTPRGAKFFLGLAGAYALSPIDIIPDFVPVIGYLDDLIILPVLLFLAVKLTPVEVIAACRAKAGGRQLIR